MKKNDTGGHEIITREGNLEIGVSSEYLGPDRISSITLAEYHSGMIHSYVHCSCLNPCTPTITEVYAEVYEYRYGLLQRVFYCLSGWKVRSFTRENFADWENGFTQYLIEFEHDADGYLKSYRYIEPPAYAGQICQVLLKRRA